MIKLITTFSLLIITSFNSFSQHSKLPQSMSKLENNIWLSELENVTSKEHKLLAIKKKIYIDTSYTVTRKSCRIKIKSKESIDTTLEKIDCECKILFFISFKKRSYILDPNSWQNTKSHFS